MQVEPFKSPISLISGDELVITSVAAVTVTGLLVDAHDWESTPLFEAHRETLEDLVKKWRERALEAEGQVRHLRQLYDADQARAKRRRRWWGLR